MESAQNPFSERRDKRGSRVTKTWSGLVASSLQRGNLRILEHFDARADGRLPNVKALGSSEEAAGRHDL